MPRPSPVLAVLLAVSCEAPPAPERPAHDASTPPPAPIESVRIPKPAFPSVREERDVEVDGKTERWRLAWDGPTEYDCFDPSCPCEGVEYGERGTLLVIRAREGEPDRIGKLGERALQRWPVFEEDMERVRGITEASIALLAERPVVRLMFFADYDHDGRATEFVLERGGSPCSMHDAILVGIDRTNGTPHAFGTARAPDVPLSLNGRWQWEDIRNARPAALAAGLEFTQFGCGNHGSGTHTSTFVQSSPEGFRATTRTYDCTRDNQRGRLIEEKPWEP
jgi:hypothetical protein